MPAEETCIHRTTQNNVNKDTPERVLSKVALRRLNTFHSYVTFFLIGSFFGLALGNSIELISELPEKFGTMLGNLDLDTFYIIIGSSVSILSRIFIFK